jgi:uncharacterized protein
MTELHSFRAEKDGFLKNDPHSPLEPEQRRLFQRLDYFPESPALRFTVTPRVLGEQETIKLPLTSGEEAEYVRWAKAEFEVEGRAAELTVFLDASSGDMFLPFKDATARSGETYGGGRYLEVERNNDGSLTLDFNYAYNPYCAYNYNWACPMTPAENVLEVPIRAGEKAFELA